jgi:hypothetical protein
MPKTIDNDIYPIRQTFGVVNIYMSLDGWMDGWMVDQWNVIGKRECPLLITFPLFITSSL